MRGGFPCSTRGSSYDPLQTKASFKDRKHGLRTVSPELDDGNKKKGPPLSSLGDLESKTHQNHGFHCRFSLKTIHCFWFVQNFESKTRNDPEVLVPIYACAVAMLGFSSAGVSDAKGPS